METKQLIKIAIADDHHIVRKGVCEIIASFEDFEIVIEATNGKELLEKLSKAKELPEIVILDVSMPKMDGYDTLAEIKKKWPDIKVLILTMFNNEYTIIRMLKNGANGYLLKNSNPVELNEALISLHKGKFYHSELVADHFFHIMQSSAITSQITEKERQLLTYSHTDLTYEQIAQKMGTTARSVEGYRDSLFEKLKVKSRPALVLWAVKLGFVSLD